MAEEKQKPPRMVSKKPDNEKPKYIESLKGIAGEMQIFTFGEGLYLRVNPKGKKSWSCAMTRFRQKESVSRISYRSASFRQWVGNHPLFSSCSKKTISSCWLSVSSNLPKGVILNKNKNTPLFVINACIGNTQTVLMVKKLSAAHSRHSRKFSNRHCNKNLFPHLIYSV